MALRRAGAATARSLIAMWIALLLGSAGLQAQEDADQTEGWYQVELLVFANRSDAALREERWPATPELRYPQRFKRLKSGALWADPLNNSELVRVEQTAPDPTFDLAWEQPLEALWQAAKLPHRERPEIVLHPLIDMRVPQEQVVLSDADSSLAAAHARINRSVSLEVLWHKQWLQRIPSREDSTAILVESEVLQGDYPELQGSILLYSSRYLHLAADLWLNTEGDYLDDIALTRDWRMPPPPAPPADPETVMLPAFRVDAGPDFLMPRPIIASSDDQKATAGEPAPGNAEASLEQPLVLRSSDGQVGTAGIPATPSAEGPGDLGADEALDGPVNPYRASPEELADFLSAPVVDYRFRHAIRIDQQRRMRSDELHYIDHPVLGILLRIRSYEFPGYVSPEGLPVTLEKP